MNYAELIAVDSIEFSFGDYRDWFVFDKDKENLIEGNESMVTIFLTENTVRRHDNKLILFNEMIPEDHKRFKMKIKKIKDFEDGEIVLIYIERSLTDYGRTMVKIAKMEFDENRIMEITGEIPDFKDETTTSGTHGAKNVFAGIS